jgi:hypothetical protein
MFGLETIRMVIEARRPTGMNCMLVEEELNCVHEQSMKGQLTSSLDSEIEVVDLAFALFSQPGCPLGKGAPCH